VEPLRNASTIADLLLKTTPLVLCALGLSVCYRANIWNIGAEGQLIAGGLPLVHDFVFRSGHTWHFAAVWSVTGKSGGYCRWCRMGWHHSIIA
jgi:ABC-type uncharacterized transport system permease subunit